MSPSPTVHKSGEAFKELCLRSYPKSNFWMGSKNVYFLNISLGNTENQPRLEKVLGLGHHLLSGRVIPRKTRETRLSLFQNLNPVNISEVSMTYLLRGSQLN